jgi:hypothetical protein
LSTDAPALVPDRFEKELVMTATPMRRRMNSSTVAVVAAIAVGVSVSSAMIMRTSSAAFSATTDNTANVWTTGSVSLTDDDSGTARFNLADDGLLRGGQQLVKCITVTYTGTINTSGVAVKFEGLNTTPGGADLSPYLGVKIERGTGGSFASCAGFVPGGAALFNGTFDTFNASVGNTYATGVDAWTPMSSSDSYTYRFTIDVDPANANAPAMGKAATADFVWEAQTF